MIKYLAIPLILVGCTAPVTHPPAEACSPPLDGSDFTCPTDWPKPKPKPKPIIPKEELRGEIDIYNPHHWQSMQFMFERNARRNEVEKNMTQPDDAINRALMEFYNGSNGSTESQELLQLSSDEDQQGS